MAIRPTQSDAAPRDNSHAWYRQSIVWLGVLVFIASIVGCVWLIIVAQRYADPELPVSGPQVMKVPVARPPKPDASP
ncbi:MAG: hypothetical protein JSS33_02485 [Proteobacteria bacterium]|nr:hypothetical protein [Pseudomonadota bacterium]